MTHIASFSTGLSSAVMVDRIIKRYGKDDCVIVAMDTACEDDDNWRFSADCEKRWGKEIIKLQDGRDPYQVAKDKQIIPNQKIAPCTFALKIQLFKDWADTHYGGGGLHTIHIGYDIFEAHRCEKTQASYESAGYKVDFPLLWEPMEFRSYSQVTRQDWNIEPPRTYDLGFTHANCLQKGCVKMGQKDWFRFLINFPERYAITEEWEQGMRDHHARKDYAIMRQQKGGKVIALTLKEFRERHEADSRLQASFFDDATPACHYCGVGDFLSE